MKKIELNNNKLIAMNMVFFFSCLIFSSVALCEGEIKKVGDNVWAGEISAPKTPGVKIYFGIERLDDQKQIEAWKTYALSIEYVSQQFRSPLSFLAKRSEPGQHPKCEGDVKRVTGMEEEEYQALMKAMEDLQMYIPKNRAGLEASKDGALEMRLEAGNYVVYASKKPVLGKFHFKDLKSPNLGRVGTLKEFQENFQDIVMSMSSWEVPGTPLISHRGITRNPMDFLDTKKTYSGISMLLHAFSAKILSQQYPDKRFMAVSPVPSMSNIIKKELRSDEMYFVSSRQSEPLGADGKTIPQATEIPNFMDFKDKIPGGNPFTDESLLIRVDALAKRFK